MAIHKGFSASIYAPDISGSFSTATSGEAATHLGDNVYQISESTRRLIDRNQEVTVYDDGAALSPASYSINYLTGCFSLQDSPGGEVTADYYYLPPLVELGQAHKWAIEVDAGVVEKSTFSDGDFWRRKEAVTRGWRGSLERYYLNSYFFSSLNAPRRLLFKFMVDETNGFAGWGGFNIKISSKIGNLVGESIGISGDGPLAWL